MAIKCEPVFCPQPFVIHKWYHFRKPPIHPLSLLGMSAVPVLCRLWLQWFLVLGMRAERGWSAMSLGTSIPAPAGIVSLSAGSLDELTVIVTSNDLELHWLPPLYVLLFYPLIKLKKSNEPVIYWVSRLVLHCHSFSSAGWTLVCDLPEASLGIIWVCDMMLLIFNNLILTVVFCVSLSVVNAPLYSAGFEPLISYCISSWFYFRFFFMLLWLAKCSILLLSIL